MSWILRHDVRPWTANSARSASHWSKNADRTKTWRTAFQLLAIEGGVPPLGACRVVVTPYLRNRSGRQDVGACAPAAKAAIDGIRDAGAWPDDTDEYVVELVFRAPVYGQGDALEIRIEPILTSTPVVFPLINRAA